MQFFISAIKKLFLSSPLNGTEISTNECAARTDPSGVFESLANSQHWSMGADMADAYGSACISPCAGLSETWSSIWSY